MHKIPSHIDRKLWVIVPGCCDNKRHYLGYNPHTFHGRISVWCPLLNRWTNISKMNISRQSEQSRYWIAGYLNGNEPECPLGADGLPVEMDSDEFLLWKRSIYLFTTTGYWNAGTRHCSRCRTQLLHSSLRDDVCPACTPAGEEPEKPDLDEEFQWGGAR
jgi:hypothetical protein